MKVSVIVPAHNEAQNIEKSIKSIERALKDCCQKNFEIIVAEDGSIDGTDKIVRRLISGNRRIILLHSNRRLGKGKAISNGFFASTGKIIFLMDADVPADLKCLPEMLSSLQSADIILGSRFIKGGIADRSLSRHLFSLLYNSMIKILFQTGVKDHQCGVKAFTREVLQDIIPSMTSEGFFWDTELIVKAKRRGYAIQEHPIFWRERDQGKSKISFKDACSLGKSALKFRYHGSYGK